MVKQRSSNLCRPRYATPRRPERETLGPAVAAVAEQLGHPLMPWQRQIADVGLELRDDGVPAYRHVTFTVPRQSGKTTLILAWEVQRALGWTRMLKGAQRIAYSAQSGKAAHDKLLDDQWPLLNARKRALGVKRCVRSNGFESIEFANGSRVVLLASSTDSGHGQTIDLGVRDELFEDKDFRREQALNPAMATRRHAQVLTASTMGTEESVALNNAVEVGRRAVEDDTGSGVCYFEWSATPDDDPGDHAVWWRCMPALGRTIDLTVVEDAYQTMQLEEFRRAYLNIPTATLGDRVIPLVSWRAVCSPDVEAVADVFAFDVNPQREAAGIVAVGDGPVVEVVDYRPGVEWLTGRICELSERYGAPFALDRSGPAGSFVPELERQKVRLLELDASTSARAAGRFFDRVMAGKIKVCTDTDLDKAVEGAARREHGDTWSWGRKSSRYDVSLLVAATVACWALENDTGGGTPWGIYA